ncbi:recombinase family protein [Streptomyces sp. NPDC088789]|uniref:recombinase family protein n=1 Tax=Streptomyces sp. NPDC088789 TaxID=3365899 RepID=UPI003808908F
MPYAPEYLHLVIPNVQFEALLYGRNSDDATKTEDSVDAQLTTGRALCKNNKWPVVAEFRDPGYSASRHARRARKGFEELLDAIESTPKQEGVVRILVAFEASRWYRSLEAYVRLRDACLHAGVLLCYDGQVYDLSRRDDRKATAMHAVDAEDEAEGIHGRNARTTRLQAEAGEPHGKNIFGYDREYIVVHGRRRVARQYEHPVSGPVVVKSLTWIDSGKSLRSLVRWLRSEPSATRHDSAQWTDNLVRAMLLNRAYLGERQYHGTYRKATWPPLKGLESPSGRAMFNRVTAKLTDPARKTQRGTEVAHLQTLIALCGECGDHAVLVGRNETRSQRPVLYCNEANDTTIGEALADAFVEEAVITWFRDKPVARAALLADDADVEQKVSQAQRRINAFEEQLREARAQAEEYDDELGRFKLSATSLASMERRLEPVLEKEQRKLRSLTGVSPLLLRMLEAEDPDAVWNGRAETPEKPAVEGLTLDQKREVLRLVVTVRLHKASRQGVRKLEPGRITLAFAGQPGFRARPLRAHGSVPAPAEAPARGRA